MYHINLIENHAYEIRYTLPVLRCFGDSCDQIAVDWSSKYRDHLTSWGSITGSDQAYNAGSLYTSTLDSDSVNNLFFADSSNGYADIYIAGYCTEADGVTPADCYIPDFQIIDLDASTPPPVTPPPVTPPPVTPPVVSPLLNSPITKPGDKTAPAISLTSDLPRIVKVFPTVSGTANDNESVARIEYSTDGGINWLPADSTPGLGGKLVNFSFTPLNLDDGNYQIFARAIDNGGNIGVTSPTWVVVDRLPSTVGGQIVSLGPQVLEPNNQGVITSSVGVDQKITLSAVGGPTAIELIATPSKATSLRGGRAFRNEVKVRLTQSPDTGLWSGMLSFKEPGDYTLVANSVDGADNKTSRTLNAISVQSASKVVKRGTNQPVAATVTVHYLEPETGSWLIWDGSAYTQTNPQTTNKDGDFNFFLPAGKYYLTADAKGYHKLTSDIFSLNQPTPISTTLTMKPGKLGPLSMSWLDFSIQKISLSAANTKTAKDSLIGQVLPSFNLSDINGKGVNSLDWLGKPTVLSFNTTWSPATAEQLPALGKLQGNADINVIPVALEEGVAKLKVYNAIAGLKITWLADPDGTLADQFKVSSLPQNYFVDRKGIIKKIISGVLSEQEISENLMGL